MNSLSLSSIALGFAVGLLLTFGAARLHYQMQLAPLRKRCEQLCGSLAQTSETLMQAHKQAESLKNELASAHLHHRVQRMTSASVRLTEPKSSNVGVVTNGAFADMLMQPPASTTVRRAA